MDKKEERIAVQIGEELRRARKARGWSQAVAAEHLDVSVDYVTLLERGKRLPSVEVLVRVSERFGVSVTTLLGLATTKDEPWAEEALTQLRAVPEDLRDAALMMLRGLSEAARPAAKGDARQALSRRTPPRR